MCAHFFELEGVFYTKRSVQRRNYGRGCLHYLFGFIKTLLALYWRLPLISHYCWNERYYYYGEVATRQESAVSWLQDRSSA